MFPASLQNVTDKTALLVLADTLERTARQCRQRADDLSRERNWEGIGRDDLRDYAKSLQRVRFHPQGADLSADDLQKLCPAYGTNRAAWLIAARRVVGALRRERADNRRRAVRAMLAKGYNVQVIADTLGITPGRVSQIRRECKQPGARGQPARSCKPEPR